MIDDILHKKDISVQDLGASMSLRVCHTLQYSQSNQNKTNALTQ